MEFKMLRSSIEWFKALSKAGKIGVVIASVFGLGIVSAATGNNQPPPTDQPKKPAVVQQKTDEITHKVVTTTESVPFETTNVDDSTLTKGTSKVTTEGMNGVKTHSFDVTYKNGIEVSRVETDSTITTPPVTKIVSVGTYVAPTQLSCPNGTYVNSAGDTVCSPYSSNSAPAGATAQCVDGTYSFSQTRSGTCSHHGGVANWL